MKQDCSGMKMEGKILTAARVNQVWEMDMPRGAIYEEWEVGRDAGTCFHIGAGGVAIGHNSGLIK